MTESEETRIARLETSHDACASLQAERYGKLEAMLDKGQGDVLKAIEGLGDTVDRRMAAAERAHEKLDARVVAVEVRTWKVIVWLAGAGTLGGGVGAGLFRLIG
jgi:hypothetical protein